MDWSFETVQELQLACLEFLEQYNREFIPERPGYLTFNEVHQKLLAGTCEVARIQSLTCPRNHLR